MEEGGADISLLENIQTRSGARPTPSSMGSGDPSRVKVAGICC